MRFDELIRESHLVADDVAQLGAELLRDALGYRAGGDAARLGVADAFAAEFERDLGDLRGLSRARLARDDHHLVVADRGARCPRAGR